MLSYHNLNMLYTTQSYPHTDTFYFVITTDIGIGMEENAFSTGAAHLSDPSGMKLNEG